MRLPPPGTRRTAIKKHFVAALGEFVGTTLFIFFAVGGTSVANTPASSGSATEAINTNVNPSQLLYISLAFGLSLAVNAWVFFRISGGLFNPAVSLGLVLIGGISPMRGAILTVSQILGAICGSALVQGLLGSLNARTTLNAETSIVRGLFLEMFLTTMLMLTILLLAAEKHKATFLAPIGIGLSLFIAELVGVYHTGGSLNPARSFGPDVVSHEFSTYHWIYWLGPAMGSCLAAGFYKLIKHMQYETVNPDQDATGDAEAEAALADAEEIERRQHEADDEGGRSNEKINRTTSRSSETRTNVGASPIALGKEISAETREDTGATNFASFEQASHLERLERKMDAVLNKRSDPALERKLDHILSTLAKVTADDSYWSLGGERREAERKGKR
ncbi:aquaporin-like protein [Mrakia frigida]|uniref:aquaporin-like protein n=1 Tax=Mrakia frigida TaxID=29902 RepID=UPI003FCC05A9